MITSTPTKIPKIIKANRSNPKNTPIIFSIVSNIQTRFKIIRSKY